MQKITVTQDDINHPYENPVEIALERALKASTACITLSCILVTFHWSRPDVKYYLPSGACAAYLRALGGYSVEPFEFYTEPL